MTCPLHTVPQSFCRACDSSYSQRVGEMIRREADIVRETIVGSGQPSPQVHVHERGDPRVMLPLVPRRTEPTDSIRDASAARIAGLEANVNEKLATIAALHDEIAQLRSVESVAIAAARLASLAAALRKALADVDPKAMSTYEQQQARREARALLEEVAG